MNNENTATRKKIGRALNALRTSLGYTRFAIARKAGISAHTVKSIEDGNDGYSIDTLLRYARAMGVYLYLVPRPPDAPATGTDFEDLICRAPRGDGGDGK
jgi:transcriptional regulator with XRE-family HTH domain